LRDWQFIGQNRAFPGFHGSLRNADFPPWVRFAHSTFIGQNRAFPGFLAVGPFASLKFSKSGFPPH
jgi:hypothetical protein